MKNQEQLLRDLVEQSMTHTDSYYWDAQKQSLIKKSKEDAIAYQVQMLKDSLIIAKNELYFNQHRIVQNNSALRANLVRDRAINAYLNSTPIRWYHRLWKQFKSLFVG